MIPRLNQWQGHNGASHRKNLDTPSLTGSCRYTNVNLFATKELSAEPVYPGIQAPEP